MIEPGPQLVVAVDVHDVDLDTAIREEPERVVAEMTAPSREEPSGRHYLRRPMRPATAVVVIILLALIVGAFLLKFGTTGLTP